MDGLQTEISAAPRRSLILIPRGATGEGAELLISGVEVASQVISIVLFVALWALLLAGLPEDRGRGDSLWEPTW